MKYLDTNSPAISEVDKGIRNGWKAHWLDELCDKGKPFSSWCKKVDVPGKCYCTVCSKMVMYGSSGKKALRIHANLLDHVSRIISVGSSTKLDSNLDSASGLKSVQDSASEVKAIIGLFISEHCLPFSLGPDLLNLCKRVSKEKQGLNSATLSSTSTTYVTTHGVAEDVKKTLSANLKDQFISLNLDEATMDSGDKVLNILAQYYDMDLGRCVIDLIGCKEVNEAPAEQVIKAVEDILKERNLDWSQIISMLMDNCSVMRGAQGGVEPKARLRNKNLLDVDGDTVHKVNNAAQKMFSSLEKFYSVQSLASEIYSDIENSPKQRSIFKQIQELLGLKRKMLFRPISTRFLQFKTVAERIIELWDPLRLYYAAFLESSEKSKVQKLVTELTEKHKLSSQRKEQITELIGKVHRQKNSEAGKKRKEKIVMALFDQELKSSLCFKLYTGILAKFEGFVKLFQSKKPHAFKLHFEIFKLVKSFFSCFMKPEAIPLYDPSKLKHLDFEDKSKQMNDRHLCVGETAYVTLMNILKNKLQYPWIKEFFFSLRKGYVDAAHMLMKLPINNPVLSKLTYIDPSTQRSASTNSALLSLATQLPNVIKETDLGKLDSELRQYVSDDEITMIDCDSDDDNFRIDIDYWSIIFRLKNSTGWRYPTLSRLVKALLSIFSGPIIEGTFNILNDIIEEDRTRLTNHNYEALLMVKSHLHAREFHATSMEIPKSMVKEVSGSYSNYKKHMQMKEDVTTILAPAVSSPCASLYRPMRLTNKESEISSPKSSSPAVASSLSSTTLTVPPAQLATDISISSNLETPDLSESLTQDKVTCDTSQKHGVKRKQSSLAGFFLKKPRT